MGSLYLGEAYKLQKPCEILRVLCAIKNEVTLGTLMNHRNQENLSLYGILPFRTNGEHEHDKGFLRN